MLRPVRFTADPDPLRAALKERGIEWCAGRCWTYVLTVAFLADFLFASLSILLYYASFHPLNCDFLAWIALVPYL
ncbi:MAG: hypothetical protein RDV41_02015, partial [Planctomycetota bacterium]|nr:hypothetical protein [Planctomycetota bacterium]